MDTREHYELLRNLPEHELRKRLKEVRVAIRGEIMYRESELTGGRVMLLCPYCRRQSSAHNPYPRAWHLHEVIYSRGDTWQDFAFQIVTMNINNCVLIHDSCHRFAEGGYGRNLCIAHLIINRGYSNVIGWAKSIDEHMQFGANKRAPEVKAVLGKLGYIPQDFQTNPIIRLYGDEQYYEKSKEEDND